jgi:hypothetical protein
MKTFLSLIVAVACLTPAVFAGDSSKPCCPSEKAKAAECAKAKAAECAKAKAAECSKSQASCCEKQAALRSFLLSHKGGQIVSR